MKRLVWIFAVLLALLPAARAAEPAPLTSLSAVHALSNAEARHGLPVVIEGTVTFYRKEFQSLFVQDGSFAIYVLATTTAKLEPGDRVRVSGTTRDSYHPIIVSTDIAILGHSAAPRAIPATFGQLIRGEYDSSLVTVHARLLAADRSPSQTTIDSRLCVVGQRPVCWSAVSVGSLLETV